MLKALRDQFKYLKWTLWVVILIFVAFIFVDFGGALGGGGGAERPTDEAAKVGGETVSMAAFRSQYQRLEDQFRQVYGDRFDANAARQMRLPVQALDQAIAQKILLIEARERGLEASDLELRRAILEMPVFQNESGLFVGSQEYAQLLADSGQSVASFERALRDELSVRKLASTLAAAVAVRDAEVEQRYREDAERASVRYLLVPGAKYTSQVTASPEELQAYFASNADAFRLPEQRVVDYLLVEAARLQSEIQPSEDELRAYYGQNIAQFTRSEQVRARHIMLRVDENRSEAEARSEMSAIERRLAAGEDFTKLASELSEDPASKSRGGDLGFFERGRMLPEFEEAAFSAEPGRVVGPIQTSFGLHLLRVEGKQPGGQTPFEQVRGQVRSRIAGERAQGLAEARATEVRAQLAAVGTTVGEAQMRPIAEASNGTVSFNTTPAFSTQDSVPGIGRGGAFADNAFLAAPGVISAPIRTPRGWVVAVVREVLAPRLPEFAEAQTRVREAVVQSKAGEAARAAAADARRQLAGGRGLDTVAQALGIEVRDSGPFGADGFVSGLGAVPELASAALALETGGVGGPISTAQGAIVFEVVERERFDPARFADERDEMRASLERQELNRLLGSLVERRRQELKVTYNRQVLEQFGVVDESGAAAL